MMRRILFISHDATRTGAPIVFLHQLRWLQQQAFCHFYFLLLDEGPLIEEFQELGEVFFWKPKRQPLPSPFKRALRRLSINGNKESSHRDQILKQLDELSFDLIYSNTVASHETAALLKVRWNIPWISHIHELSYSIESYFKKAVNNEILDKIDHAIFVSKATQASFLNKYNFPVQKSSIIYESVPIRDIKPPNRTSTEVRTQFQIDSNKWIVGGCGVMSWRKGIDLFIQTARRVQQLGHSNIQFVWVGEIKRDVVEGYVYENEQLNLTPNIIFTGALVAPGEVFQIFDVFYLSSREDPFPLVCLEAAALNKPILCFENSGGIPEWISSGGGAVLPFLNIDEVAHKIAEYCNDRSLLLEHGSKVKESVQTYDVNSIAPKIKTLILDVMGRSNQKSQT